MYVLFHCDCGRGLYAKEGVATRKCVCGKAIKVKSRRIFGTVETQKEASEAVRAMQEEKYGEAAFQTADKITKRRHYFK
ncbi:MAG: DUF1922 domain-containing protein [Methanobacteriaceae archaeon]